MECFQPCTKDQLLNNIYGEFNATEESVERDVQYLIEWMRQQPFLPNVRDKDILISFLLRGKFQLEKTKKAIERYYIARALMPQIFQNYDVYDESLHKAVKITNYTPIPKLTPDGYRVIIMKIYEHTEKDMFTEEGALRAHQMAMDVVNKFDRHKGIIFVMDVKHISMAYAKVMMTGIKKYIKLALEVTPLRFHKIYVLNMMPIADTLFQLMKFVMKKKILDRVEFWNGPEKELATVIPKENLPIEYGGTEKTLKQMFDQWLECFYSTQDWFTSEENMKADLSKKSLDRNFYDYEFGVEGSFRQISLD